MKLFENYFKLIFFISKIDFFRYDIIIIITINYNNAYIINVLRLLIERI